MDLFLQMTERERHVSIARNKTEVGSEHANADSCTGQVIIVYLIGGVWCNGQMSVGEFRGLGGQ